MSTQQVNQVNEKQRAANKLVPATSLAAYADGLLDQVDTAHQQIQEIQTDMSLLQTMENALGMISENMARVRRLAQDALRGNASHSEMDLLSDEILNLLMANMLIVEDTESRPKSAVEAAHKLADVNKLSVCLGGWSSGIALPTAEYLIIRKQLYEMGVRDFSKFYHYNLSAMAGVPDPS